MPALRPLVSSPLPSEPDLRISPHPALHEHLSGCPLVQLPLSVKYPLRSQAAARRCSPATSFHPIVLLAHWTPSPCRRLSRPPWWRVTATTTTGPPPRPGGNSGRCACPEQARRAPPGRFPRSLICRSAGSAPSCTPGASPRATATPHVASTDRTANGRPRRVPNRNRGPSTPTAHSRQFRGCSWVSGLLALVRLLRLSALLPHPARWRRTVARLSGAAPALRRTSGIRLPLSFTRPLRRPAARSLTPPGHMAPRGAVLVSRRRSSHSACSIRVNPDRPFGRQAELIAGLVASHRLVGFHSPIRGPTCSPGARPHPRDNAAGPRRH